MPLETPVFISDLVTANPPSTDPKSEGAAHLRNIKTALKATFPNVTGAVTATQLELNQLAGSTSAVQTQLNTKAPLISPIFTVAATLPAATTIGTVTAAEVLRLSGVTAPIQTQINTKAPLLSPVFVGVVNLPPTGFGLTEAVTKSYADALSMAAALPAQTGNAGKIITTNGVSASWQTNRADLPITIVTSTTQTAVDGNHYVMSNAALSTLTLPASPANGAGIDVTFANGRTDNVIARNGSGLMVTDAGVPLLEDMVYDVPSVTLSLVYAGNAWRFEAQGSSIAITETVETTALNLRNATETAALLVRNSTEAAALLARGTLGPNLAAGTGSGLVGFLQAGTFGVARTVQEKLRDVLHLKDFGLGTVSDITCINRAMADANLLGGADIICPVRNYTFGPTDQLVIPRSVTLKGSNTGPFENTANPATTLVAATFSITNTTSAFIVLDGVGAKVEDILFFYPNQVAPTASTPIVYPYTITCTTGRGCQRIRRCTFVNSYNAIEILSGRVSVEDCLIGAFKNDILIDTALDWVELTNVKCQSMWNVFAGALPFPQAIDTWVMNNSAALVTRRVDSLVAVNFSVFGRYIGHSAEDSPITSLSPRGGYGRLTNVDFDYVAYGIIASSCIFVAHGFKYTNIEIGANGSGVGTPGQAAVITNVGGTQSPIISLIGGAVRGVWAAGSTATQNNAAGGKIFTKEVRGINPFGPLSAPAFPASGVAVTNAFSFPVRVFLAGGTVTNVSINGSGVGNSLGMYIVEPYESIAVTYTATPAWSWLGS